MADRMCDSCGQVDDHPRHVHGLGPGEEPTPPEVAAKAIEAAVGSSDLAAIIAHSQDKTTAMKHLDCCAADGCPDGSCDALRSVGAEELKGDDLKSFLTSGDVDHVGKELSAKVAEKTLAAVLKETA